MKHIVSLALFVIFFIPAHAQTDSLAHKEPKAEIFKSQQRVTIDGKALVFATECGTLKLRDEEDKPIALFGFTGYTRSDSHMTENRPIVFAFNGGPLAASLWLHMGILGPKRVVIKDAQFNRAAPYKIVNNDYSILDVADLVMIDPVGVGLSKAIGKSKYQDFWGVDQDIKSIAQFIEQYLITHGRLNSAKFLLGESYGTFRNAGLMRVLQDNGIAMNGVIMVSSVFELQHLLFPPGDDLAYELHFPTYAATAWYHDKIKNKNPDLQAFLDDVRQFTKNEYAPALMAGDDLAEDKKNEMAKKLAGYSGLSQDYWMKANLRVNSNEFFAELLRNEGKTVGRFDSRFTGINRDLLSQYAISDPQDKAISPPFITAFKNYLYNDLKVRKDLNYIISASSRKGFKWDWKHRGNINWNAQTAISTATDMATALSENPNLKVLILCGYYDLATPFFGVEYTINHLNLAPEIKNNITLSYFTAGHMMYVQPASMKKFKTDVAGFINELK